eukprot:801260-Rhodomonas_salina.2
MPSLRRCSKNRHKPSARCRETTGKMGISCAALKSRSCDTQRWYASHVWGLSEAPMVSRYDATRSSRSSPPVHGLPGARGARSGSRTSSMIQAGH